MCIRDSSADVRARTGRKIRVEASYLASGAQTRAVLGGFPADVVVLAMAPDVEKLVAGGLVEAAWSRGPDRGFVTSSVVAFAVRTGNPKGISTWADLARKAKDPDKMLDRVEALSLVVAKALLRELTRAKVLSKATAPLHYRYGTVLERDGEVDRAIEVFQAMQGSVGNYRDIEQRVRRLARGEGRRGTATRAAGCSSSRAGSRCWRGGCPWWARRSR